MEQDKTHFLQNGTISGSLSPGSQPPPHVLPGTEGGSQHKPCGPLRWTEQCLRMNCANPGENASPQRSQAWLHALSVQPRMMNFPCGRHPGTIATGPNPNAFLTFPLLTSRQGEKIYLKKNSLDRLTESQKDMRQFFERLQDWE